VNSDREHRGGVPLAVAGKRVRTSFIWPSLGRQAGLRVSAPKVGAHDRARWPYGRRTVILGPWHGWGSEASVGPCSGYRRVCDDAGGAMDATLVMDYVLV